MNPIGYCDKCKCDRSTYFSDEHDNFYCITCKHGMGTPFYIVHAQPTAVLTYDYTDE